MQDEENKNNVNEPATGYGKRITFFKSFEEEQEAQIQYWRSLTPEQRFEQHRVISFHAFSASKKYKGNRLTFN